MKPFWLIFFKGVGSTINWLDDSVGSYSTLLEGFFCLHTNQSNLGKYTLHGWYGVCTIVFFLVLLVGWFGWLFSFFGCALLCCVARCPTQELSNMSRHDTQAPSSSSGTCHSAPTCRLLVGVAGSMMKWATGAPDECLEWCPKQIKTVRLVSFTKVPRGVIFLVVSLCGALKAIIGTS